MLAFVAVIAGLFLGLAAGGSFRTLQEVRLPHEGLILCLFVGQAFARSPLGLFLGDATVVVWGTCSLVLFVVCVKASGQPGLGVIAVGVASNGLVILLNGSMPIVPSSDAQAGALHAVLTSHGFYSLADSATALVFLGDVVPAGIGLASLGDILLAVGLCVFLVHALLPADGKELSYRS